MLVADIIRLSTRMFRTNRSRTILTILGISIGIGAILFLVSLGYGLQQVILSQITTSDSLLSMDVTKGDLGEIALKSNVADDISKIAGVDKMSSQISISSQMAIGDISTEVEANFVSSDFFVLDGTILEEGDFYTDSEDDKIVISSATLHLFNLEVEESMNKPIRISVYVQDDKEEYYKKDLEKDFYIKGIIEDEETSYIFLPFSLSGFMPEAEFSKIKVKVDEEDNLNFVRDEIISKGFAVSALSDIIEQANKIFKVAQIVLALFGIVALAVSAIGMFNTMTIALLERTQEIGIMKALGATSFDVWKMFLAESLMIGFLGGMTGILIGILGGEIFNYALNLLAGALGGDKIDLFYAPPWFIAFIAIFSTVIGVATGFYPAKRAARISSLEALRYK